MAGLLTWRLLDDGSLQAEASGHVFCIRVAGLEAGHSRFQVTVDGEHLGSWGYMDEVRGMAQKLADQRGWS